jgi:hypothetical protein
MSSRTAVNPASHPTFRGEVEEGGGGDVADTRLAAEEDVSTLAPCEGGGDFTRLIVLLRRCTGLLDP